MNTDLTTVLAILQQAEYDWTCLQTWVDRHPNLQPPQQPEKWTPKLKLLRTSATSLFFLPLLLRVRVALLLLSVPDLLTKHLLILLAQRKLRRLQKTGLTTVAIAGSYGKTSTKFILKHSLAGSTSMIATPASVNVMLGMALFVLKELSTKHQVVLFEFGEYSPDDVKEMVGFVKPDYAVITPIGRQHLERFGSVEAVAANIAHLVEYFAPNTRRVLVHELSHQFFSNQTKYGQDPSCDWHVSEYQLSPAGSEFTVTNQDTQLPVFTPWFGKHQAINTLPSFWLAAQLSIPSSVVLKNLRTLPFLEHRHQPFFAEQDVLLLDNGYNSNPDSIQASLQVLTDLNPSVKIIITPGFVEVGEQSKQIHHQLGRLLAERVDVVGLVSSPATDWIKSGFLDNQGNQNHILVGDNQQQLVAMLQPFIKAGAVILFENGVNEVYR